MYEGKLIANAVETMELVDIGRSYDEQGIVPRRLHRTSSRVRRLMARNWLQFRNRAYVSSEKRLVAPT